MERNPRSVGPTFVHEKLPLGLDSSTIARIFEKPPSINSGPNLLVLPDQSTMSMLKTPLLFLSAAVLSVAVKFAGMGNLVFTPVILQDCNLPHPALVAAISRMPVAGGGLRRWPPTSFSASPETNAYLILCSSRNKCPIRSISRRWLSQKMLAYLISSSPEANVKSLQIAEIERIDQYHYKPMHCFV